LIIFPRRSGTLSPVAPVRLIAGTAQPALCGAAKPRGKIPARTLNRRSAEVILNHHQSQPAPDTFPVLAAEVFGDRLAHFPHRQGQQARGN
jgi:hypothetical protein